MVKASLYRTGAGQFEGWGRVHVQEPRGYAYAVGNHYVHIYGRGDGLWGISPGLTVSMGKQFALVDWVKQQFGAEDIEMSLFDVGESIEGVWRPGIFFDSDMFAGLGQNENDLRSAEQRLLLLIQRLDEVLLYIEPSTQSLEAFGQKTRELLILACTDVEAQWKYYLDKAGAAATGQGFKTTDYIRLKDPLYLSEYEVAFPLHSAVQPIRPFLQWTTVRPTQSLTWYHQYNETKHDGLNKLSSATVLACIQAVAANLVMFSVRFGPNRLFGGQGMLSAFANSHFSISLRNPDPKTFYTPIVDVSERLPSMTWGHAKQLSPTPKPFQL
ncbi:hypothetical protein ACNJYD_08980 [Bradyrhizobium sp. DASA03005]|uniref:hypothetical protein n=1 Tax=Bradyrhizobium sp. SPXBL-02 TaxID=3395912 RepID=UPI003F718824